MAVILGRKSGSSGGGGGPPSGAAGGDLSGTYPNPALSVAKQAELDGKVPKSLYDAQTVLAATTDNTPAAVTMGASTFLARLATGNIVAATVAQAQLLLNPITENIQVASYGLLLADAGLCVVMNVGSGNNLTIPLNSTQAFPVGTTIEVFQLGAGQTSIVATGGVTTQSPGGKLKLTGQYSSATLRKRATDTWAIAGDLAA